MDDGVTPLSRFAAQGIIADSHWESGWYCLNCKRPRDIEDWGKPCVCGGVALAADEEHRFRLTDDVLAEEEDQPEGGGDSGDADVVPESASHSSPSTRSAGR